MRLKWPIFFMASVFFFHTENLNAQDCVRTGLNQTVLTSACNQTCRNLSFQVPDLRSSTDYVVVNTPYSPFPYVTATGTIDTRLYDDDNYSNVFNLPFPFCFYGTVYNQAVISSNGLITFDPVYANCPNSSAAYEIVSGLPFASASSDCNSDHYPRASIMGVFMDLDPRPGPSSTVPSSPPDRKIEWRVEGSAPCRRFVVSFYKIGVWENTNCGRTNPATFQIVIYESSGLIDVYIENKVCNAAGPDGSRAILGIHDITRTKFLTAPGKNGTPGWTSSREGYRFVPNGGTSRFVSSELLRMDLSPVALATTTNTTPGLLDINFANVCTPAATAQYIIRTTYAACDNPATLLIGMDTITINKLPGDFAPTINSIATACPGVNNGSIRITPTTGSAPYSFTITPGGTTQTGSSANFTLLAAGTYNIEITDALGCFSSVSATVNDGAGLVSTATKTNVLCNGGANGTITVAQPSSGTAPFEYSLDGINWQSSPVFSGLIAGIYNVRFREANNCTGSLSAEITQPVALSATASAVPVICNGESNGVITITPAGGTGPYQYSIDGGTTWQPANTFNVPDGAYTINIRDANGCMTTQSANVTEPPVLNASSVNTAASCDGGDDGVINVTANGGNPGYQYSIDGVNFQSSNIFNVAPGNYTVTVKDNRNCTTSFPAGILLGNNFMLTPQMDATICEGKSTQLSVSSNATQYSWTPAAGLSSTAISNPVASPSVTTEYIVTATLGRCSGEDRVIVNVTAAPIPDAGANGFICYGQTYQLNASGGVKYSWSPATYLDDPLSASPIANPLRDITYSLSITEDANGCASVVPGQITIDVTPPIKVQTFPFDTVAYAADQFQLLAVPSDPDAISFSWTPTIGLSNPTIANPIVTAGAIGDIVQYRVVTSTLAGCRGEGFVTVKVYKGPDIYVPTGFTPNNDGKNDLFMPFPVGIKSYKYFRVFDRWGQMVFSSSRMHEGWNGRIDGREQPTGTYVWMIEGLTNDNKVITKKGTVTLIR